MNTAGVLFQLTEAQEHLATLIREVKDGKIDHEFEVQYYIEHIIDHLCFAWNTRDLSVKETGELPQEEFERRCNAVPDAFAQRTLQR